MPRRTMFLALAILAACGPPPAVKPPIAAPLPATVTAIPRQPDTAALTHDIPRLIRISELPGLSMAVVRNGRVIWAGAFGTVNDRTHRSTPGPSSRPHRSASRSSHTS
ncbi:MAG: hypothetical protein ABI766_13380, partial [Gemmatimonadales bacterium]